MENYFKAKDGSTFASAQDYARYELAAFNKERIGTLTVYATKNKDELNEIITLNAILYGINDYSVFIDNKLYRTGSTEVHNSTDIEIPHVFVLTVETKFTGFRCGSDAIFIMPIQIYLDQLEYSMKRMEQEIKQMKEFIKNNGN